VADTPSTLPFALTPIYSSWLNQVEGRLALVNAPRDPPRLNSVTDLKRKINNFIDYYNHHRRHSSEPQPLNR
jgi:hypothetical protein